MKKKNKPFTIYDFIIFLKAKIAIIMISTFLLSSITIFFQASYKDEWKVGITRIVDKKNLVQSIMLIKQQNALAARELGLVEQSMDPIEMMKDLNNLSISTIISHLSNNDINYVGLGLATDENFLKKMKYELVIGKDFAPNIDILNKKINIIFSETNQLTRDIVKMQYGIDNFNKDIFNFNIVKIKKIQGYNYEKIFKIIILFLIVNIFFIFIFLIRKDIKLF